MKTAKKISYKEKITNKKLIEDDMNESCEDSA